MEFTPFWASIRSLFSIYITLRSVQMQPSLRRHEQFTCPTRGCLAPILAEYGGERPRNPAWGMVYVRRKEYVK